MTRQPEWRLLIALFALFAVLTCGFDVSEGRDDAELARYIVASGRLSMDQPLNANWVAAPDGRFYSSHEAGNAIALIPVVVAADTVASTLHGVFPTAPPTFIAGGLTTIAAALYVALTAVAMFVCLTRISGMSATSATALTMVAAVTTMWAPYSRMLFDGVLGGALIAWSIACAVLAVARRSPAQALLSGALCGAAFATRQPLVVIGLAAFAHLLIDAPREQRARFAVLFVAAAIPFAIWQLAYNAMRTGSPLVPAVAMPQFQRVNGAGNPIEGLAGLLFSPGKSMFLYSPLLLLAPFGWPRLRHRAPGLAGGLLIGVIVYLLLHASIRNWSGEWGWGPRYVVPLVAPLMILSAVFIADVSRHSRKRTIVAALAAVGLIVQIIALSTNWHYRSSALVEEGRYDRSVMAWSWERGQFADSALVFAKNLARVAGMRDDYVRVGGASPATTASGNGINVWPTVALAGGMPPLIVWSAFTVGLVVAAQLVRIACRP